MLGEDVKQRFELCDNHAVCKQRLRKNYVLCESCHKSAWCSGDSSPSPVSRGDSSPSRLRCSDAPGAACRGARRKQHSEDCTHVDFTAGRKVPAISVSVENPNKALETIVREIILRVGPQLYPAPDHDIDMTFSVRDALGLSVMSGHSFCAATTSRHRGVVDFHCNETPDTRLPVGTYGVTAAVSPQALNQDARRVVKSVGNKRF